MSAEILTWGFIATFYIAAFAVLQLEKHWHRTAQVFFSLATLLALGRLVLWIWTNPDALLGGVAFTLGVCAVVANIWFVRKVDAHISDGQSAKASPANDAVYRRSLIETWRSMIVLAERKYMGGKEAPGTSFSEIFQRQPAFIQLVPLLSKEAIDALDGDVRDEPIRKERQRPVALRSLLAKEISRIETELELFPRVIRAGPSADRKPLFEINKRNTTSRVVMLGLLLLLVVVAGLVIWYLTFAASEIRPAEGSGMSYEFVSIRELKAKTEMLVTVKRTYKNYSFFKEGYIDKAEVFQPSLKGRAEVEIVPERKDIIGPRQEKNLTLQLLITLDDAARGELINEGRTAQLDIKLYDNTGRPIQLHDGHTDILYLTFRVGNRPDKSPTSPIITPPH